MIDRVLLALLMLNLVVQLTVFFSARQSTPPTVAPGGAETQSLHSLTGKSCEAELRACKKDLENIFRCENGGC